MGEMLPQAEFSTSTCTKTWEMIFPIYIIQEQRHDKKYQWLKQNRIKGSVNWVRRELSSSRNSGQDANSAHAPTIKRVANVIFKDWRLWARCDLQSLLSGNLFSPTFMTLRRSCRKTIVSLITRRNEEAPSSNGEKRPSGGWTPSHWRYITVKLHCLILNKSVSEQATNQLDHWRHIICPELSPRWLSFKRQREVSDVCKEVPPQRY